MKLLLSITTKAEGKTDLNKMFAIYDPNNNSFHYLKFNSEIKQVVNGNRGMGMCYFENFWYAGIFCVEHRVGSRLLIVDLETGIQKINKLMTTKAIHSVRPLGKCSDHYNMILACSTQNDLITILTTYETEVITEDVFFDYLNHKERIKLDWSKEYVYDDLLHANDCCIHNGNIYSSMFYNFKNVDGIDKKIKTRNTVDLPIRKEDVDWKLVRKNWRKNKTDNGAIWDLTNFKLIYNKTIQPHSIIINQFNELVFCESGTYKLINATTKKQAQCKGFTRGLVEDKNRGGYWVGLSYHRVFSDLLPGAGIEFVNYDMQVEQYIDLQEIGLEIYDILEFKKGAWSL